MTPLRKRTPWRRRRWSRRAGLGAALMFVLFALLIITFFARELLWRQPPGYALVVVFPHETGLRPGSPVWFAGYRVGVVQSVHFLSPGPASGANFAANAVIDTAHWTYVRADSEPRIARPRLLQRVMVLDIVPGSAAAPVLQPGDTLRARPPVRVDRLVEHAREIGPAIDSLLAEGRALDATARARLAGLHELELELATARTELHQLRTDIGAAPILRLGGDPTVQAKLDRTRTAAKAAAAALDAYLGTTGPAAARLVQRLELLITSIAELEAALEVGGGFLARGAHDPAIDGAVDRIRAQIDSLLADLRRQPFF